MVTTKAISITSVGPSPTAIFRNAPQGAYHCEAISLAARRISLARRANITPRSGLYGALPQTPQTLSFEKGFDPKELAWNYFCLDLFRMMTTSIISMIFTLFWTAGDVGPYNYLKIFRCVITENISIIFAVLRRATAGRPYRVVFVYLCGY